ncbi:MAG: MFS transporter [Acidisphaera sp.]|nr:MFS transporter [Acidisphaera sp.]
MAQSQTSRHPDLSHGHGLVAFPHRVAPWIEPWFFAYACLGVVQGGLLPMLLPLSASDPTRAGTIVGAMNLAGLSAPFWGHFADRRGLHRPVLLAGLAAVLVALLLMPVPLSLPVKTAVAVLLGMGFAAANTVATMFIVEVRPQEEWDARIGAFQAMTGLGQVAGLLTAGVIGGRYALAFSFAAVLVAAAVPIAWWTLRAVHIPTSRNAVVAHAPIGGEGWAGAPHRMHHLPTWRGLKTVLRNLEMPFARHLLVWFGAFSAISAVNTLFPLALLRGFGVGHGVPATTYAFAAALSLGLYPVAAALAKRRGPRLLLRAGLTARTVAIALLALAFLEGARLLPLALAAFVLLVLAWPLLAVSGTALAAQLAPGEKGEALGLFNASAALAGAVGAVLGGAVMQAFGYGRLCMGAAVVVAVAAMLSRGAATSSANARAAVA